MISWSLFFFFVEMIPQSKVNLCPLKICNWKDILFYVQFILGPIHISWFEIVGRISVIQNGVAIALQFAFWVPFIIQTPFTSRDLRWWAESLRSFLWFQIMWQSLHNACLGAIIPWASFTSHNLGSHINCCNPATVPNHVAIAAQCDFG